MKILCPVWIIPSIYAVFLKTPSMSKNPRITHRKSVGNAGEAAAAFYLQRHGYEIVARNIARKTGELDIVAKGPGGLHIVEVKTLACREFPPRDGSANAYDPSMNLHGLKIRKIARTAEWYLADIGWGGEWQLDAALVWRRERDGRCLVRYLPQIS
jgi:putative endonuclease